ncbi:hypothetical protein [Dehalococcoides mccartyi]|jgi:hypothetical protein|uniref:hypothetical protein n=1 Tax=Dehalococcoides mccartyi TaxID=61435 RepID=UPI0003C81966|nr:hypothetical protein [Dehalococcoides mccartyi]AHB12879.1 reductive dehalogenase anchoring protein [Dehalococcoides mccartyi GY50]AII57317.1 dehalogenase [Dehalococcoides mccartyi CG1]
MGFFVGLFIGIALLAAILWMKRKDINFTWYDWVIGVFVLILGVLATQHYIASVGHEEAKAGLLGLALFGGLAIVLGLIEWQIIARRKKV